MRSCRLLIFLLLSSYIGFAQNYQCLQAGPSRYYTNADGYLRGMRIDSVRVSGSDIIYYPFRTARGPYGCVNASNVIRKGGSWLGGSVIQRTDGTFYFDNIWNDTVVIKTQAHLGDSWIFFDDTTQISYKAKVSAVDTMSILGVVDSIKQITIEADSAGVINLKDSVHNFQMVLSKNHGFVQVFDLMTFPYHWPNLMDYERQFFDYYFDLLFDNVVEADISCFWPTYGSFTSKLIFKAIDYHIPRQTEIYDFAPGDVYETFETRSGGSSGYEITTLDSYYTRVVVANGINYTGVRHIMTKTYSGMPGPPTTTYNVTIPVLHADTALMFPANMVPEEWGSDAFYHYFPNMARIGICNTDVHKRNADNIQYGADSATVVMYSVPGMGAAAVATLFTSYGVGEGGIQSGSNNPATGNNSSKYNVYMVKNGMACGSFYSVSVEGVVEPMTDVRVYPNPGSFMLTVTASAYITDVTIVNSIGQVLYQNNPVAKKADIDISGLAPGLYFVRVNSIVTTKFVKQ